MYDRWETPSRGDFDFYGMVGKIVDYIHEDQGSRYQIVVGTDSQTFPTVNLTRYVTAVIVRRMGKGAQYYINKRNEPRVASVRQKVWREVVLTYETLTKLRGDGRLRGIEIVPHVDVGENGLTKDLIREVIGVFIGEECDVCIKPYSYAASSVADRHSK